MKQKLTILFFIIATVGFAQQLHYRTAGTVYDSEGKRLNSNAVRAYMDQSPEALKLYNAGRSKKTFGNVFFYSGLAIGTLNVIKAMATTNITAEGTAERTKMTGAIIGGILVVASIPIKIGYPKKIKQALTSYNSKLAENTNDSEPIKTTIVASNNQVGVRITF
ncbi:hypothetical protein ACFFLS_23990 [Flavobacterium procerum]|uniref:Uncharacterized protein n=1 Tax=Flavobacterium procerum TaxID=1455569 RepID=A0ABV6C1I5_9FLAO